MPPRPTAATAAVEVGDPIDDPEDPFPVLVQEVLGQGSSAGLVICRRNDLDARVLGKFDAEPGTLNFDPLEQDTETIRPKGNRFVEMLQTDAVHDMGDTTVPGQDVAFHDLTRPANCTRRSALSTLP